MRKRTSSGEARSSMETIIEFTATDLPDPVVPAMSRWGIFARSAMYGMPSMSLPRHIASLLCDFWKTSCSASSRSTTI